MPGLNLGDTFPNLEVDTTHGKLKFHDWGGDSWSILFSHPRDFTPVCTTELGCVSQLDKEFADRNVKLMALSCDSVEDHKIWAKDVQHYAGKKDDYPFPIIADPKRVIAKQLGMIDPDEKDETGMPLTCRAVFVVGPDKKLKLMILYPATTGRNFREILRVIDSLQLTAAKKVATPVDWTPGEKVMVVPSLNTEEAKKLFPKGVEKMDLPSGRDYMRYTPDPK